MRIAGDAIEPGFTIPRESVVVTPAPGYYLRGWYITVNGVTTYYDDPDAIYNLVISGETSFEPIWGNYAEDEAEAARQAAEEEARTRAAKANDDGQLAKTGDPLAALPVVIIALLAAIALIVACLRLRSRDD